MSNDKKFYEHVRGNDAEWCIVRNERGDIVSFHEVRKLTIWDTVVDLWWLAALMILAFAIGYAWEPVTAMIAEWV